MITYIGRVLQYGNNNPQLDQPARKLAQQALSIILVLSIARYLLDFIIWQYAGPLSLIAGLLLAHYYIRQSGKSWSDFGLRKQKWWKVLLWYLLLMALLVFCTFLGHQTAQLFFEKAARNTDRFGDLYQNLPLTLFWVSSGILIGGFAEEMMYRGYLINTLEKAIGRRLGTLLGVLIPALFWAARHFYFSGAYGSVIVLYIGILFGLFYLLNDRNLWPIILAHATIDSMAFIGRYYGWAG